MIGTPSQRYGVSLAIWDHTMLLATGQRWNAPHLNPSQIDRYSVYLPRRDGRLSWPWWLVTQTVTHLSSKHLGLIATWLAADPTTSRFNVHDRYISKPNKFVLKMSRFIQLFQGTFSMNYKCISLTLWIKIIKCLPVYACSLLALTLLWVLYSRVCKYYYN